jgi:cytoskeletal protein CcmA (bactofilin family)
MGIFGKKGDALEQEIQKAEGEAISSIIDKSMSITGEISFQGKAMIDGSINGNIKGDHLILSKSGKITGDIQVSTFTCHGQLVGNIQATIVTARKDCSIRGKLEAGSLTVEPGALLDGEIKAATQELQPVETNSKQNGAQLPGKNKKTAEK